MLKNNNAQRIRNSLILHLRPVSLPARAIRFTHTFGLGGMALVLVLLLMFTGVLMMFAYEPSPERAWLSIQAFQEETLFGRLVRGVHYWSANLLIPITVLHLLRVYLTGAFRGRRRTNWFLGLGMLFFVLLSGFTGYLLPWDQTAYWAITICTEMIAQVPGVGTALREAILGGSEIGPAAVINFYALHVAVTPMALGVMLIWHFWHIRMAGGVVMPKGPVDDPRTAYRAVPMVPDLLLRETVVALVLIAAVLVAAIAFGAPLGEPANPGVSPNPAKAPWYFLGFQELLIHFDAVFAVLVIPLVVCAGLIAIPYLPYDADQSGDWFLTPRGGRTAFIAALVALISVPAWVWLDEQIVGSGGWLPDATSVISSGLIPFAILFLGVFVFYMVVRKHLNATRNEAVQSVFVLLLVAFAVLTITGVWFRGAGMALGWPWEI